MELLDRKRKDETLYYDLLIDVLCTHLPPVVSFLIVDFLPFCVHENCIDSFTPSSVVGECDSVLQCKFDAQHEYCTCCETRCIWLF